MSFEKEKGSGTRRKARESALQMLFAADVAKTDAPRLSDEYWAQLGDESFDDNTRNFANELVSGTLENLNTIDDRIRTRAEHWRIERMALVDRNVLRLAVFEFLFKDTPRTVVINEGLEIARRFSSYEATQFINGILDSIKLDLEAEEGKTTPPQPGEPEKSQASSN